MLYLEALPTAYEDQDVVFRFGACVQPNRKLTLCFSRSSLEREALMILRRRSEGAEKWAFLLLRREELTSIVEAR